MMKNISKTKANKHQGGQLASLIASLGLITLAVILWNVASVAFHSVSIQALGMAVIAVLNACASVTAGLLGLYVAWHATR